MKTGRFFVTYVVILGIAAIVACSATRDREARGRAQDESLKHAASEGNEQVKMAYATQLELNSKYHLPIALDASAVDEKSVARTQATIEKYDWKTWSLSDRRDAQAKLARFLVAINRILEIDAQKNITVDKREQILVARDAAELCQKSIENFERVNGENFDAKRQAAALP